MVKPFVSDPIELPEHEEGDPAVKRRDLAFYGVDHSGSSYEAKVFINHPEANDETPREDDHYAGSFFVFGHGGCFGDEGHCDVPTGARDPFDRRAPHQLTPVTKLVNVTEALERLVDVTRPEQSITVTVVAETPGDRSDEILAFDRIRLLTYV